MADTPSAWALERARAIPGVDGFYGPAKSDVARALDAAYRAGVEATLKTIDERVELWKGQADGCTLTVQNELQYGLAPAIRALPAPETDA